MPPKKLTKQEQLNKVVKNLFNGVTEDDVLQQNGKQILKKGKPLSKAEVKAYSVEAQDILKTKVWEEIYNSLRLAANKKMYEDSTSFEDMYFGKAMLWNLNVIKKKLENLSKLDTKL